MSHVRIEKQGHLATVIIDRPEKKNAITVQMYEDLITSLNEADNDEKIRVVKLKGSGDVFTAGNDLKDFMNLAAVIQQGPMDSAVVRLLFTLVDFNKPLVAEVRGPAVGIGTTMLLHHDFVYASESAKFIMPFVSLGVCAEGASSVLLPKLAGRRRASEYLLLCEPIDAHAAVEIGLANKVLPDDELSAHVDEVCQKLIALPAGSIRVTKRLLVDGERERVKDAIRREVVEFGARLISPEAAEAFTAFMEKREPDFTQFSANGA